MRIRKHGNPYHEIHGQPITCIDWFASDTLSPVDVRSAVEAVIGPLVDPSSGAVKGYLNISMDDGEPLYVSLQLYEFDCLDRACPAGHTSDFVRGADLTSAQERGLEALEIKPITDDELHVRFSPIDPPNRPTIL